MDAVVAVTAFCAVAAASAAAYMYRKCKEKIARVRVVMDSLKKRNESLKRENAEWRNLSRGTRLEYSYDVWAGGVRVVAHDLANPAVTVILKVFPFNRNDVDDYKFAVMEAGELIEKLSE